MPSIPIHPPPSTISLTSSSSSTPILSPLPTPLHTHTTGRSLAIIEIQGTLHIPPSTSPDQTAEVEVGRLEFPYLSPNTVEDDKNWMKRVYLYIGRNQRLTGEVKRLGKPLGVVRKMGRQSRPENIGEPGDDNEDAELQIVDVVEYKIVFGSRPEPVGD